MWAPFLGRHLHDVFQHRVNTRKRALSLQLAIEVVCRACGTSALDVKGAVEAFRVHWSLPKRDGMEEIADHMEIVSIELGRRIQELGLEVGRAWAKVSRSFELATVIMEDSQAAAASVIQNLLAFAAGRERTGTSLQPTSPNLQSTGAQVANVGASHGFSAVGEMPVDQKLSRPSEVLATEENIFSCRPYLSYHAPATGTTQSFNESHAAEIYDSKRLKSTSLLQNLPFRPAINAAQAAAFHDFAPDTFSPEC